MSKSDNYPPALTAQEVESIQTLYRAFTEKNSSLVDLACAPEWQDIPPAPGQAAGPDGLKELMPMFFRCFPDLKIVVHEIVGSHERAGVRASLVGTHLGEILGVPPSGQKVKIALHEAADAPSMKEHLQLMNFRREKQQGFKIPIPLGLVNLIGMENGSLFLDSSSKLTGTVTLSVFSF